MKHFSTKTALILSSPEINDIKNILRDDKNKRIEGYSTEYLFGIDLINQHIENSSSEWWFPRRRDNSFFSTIKLFYNHRSIRNTDLVIMNYFLKFNIKTYLVFYEETENWFFYIKYDEIINVNFENIDEWESVYYSCRKRCPENENIEYTNDSEIEKKNMEKSLRFLEDKDLLKKIAIQRVFANCFLNYKKFFYCDVDAFLIYKDKLLAFEVKQKFPAEENYFGLSVGLIKLFNFLDTIGIECVYSVLQKTYHNKTKTSIDYNTMSELFSEQKWVAVKYKKQLLGKKRLGGSNDGIFGGQGSCYRGIDVNWFTHLKNFNSENNFLNKFLDDNIIIKNV